jgi:hypothetical protein
MERDPLLQLLAPMLANFKQELRELREAGATQADIEQMLDRFEQTYAEDAESRLVVEILRQAARTPN